MIPSAILRQHIASLGKTGSGKTSTAKLAIEQIVRDDPSARVCVLDPLKSDWWGLTSSADGKSEGLPFYVLGGPHGHVALHESAGKAIGDLVATGALPLSIIDMADFAPGGLQKFFNDFVPALMKRMRGVLHLVIEEAHEFAPKERAGIGAETAAIYHAKKLATAGRSKGVRMMVITQRTQALHNALLGSCDTIIAHRLTAPADQEPVKKWLKANVSKEIYDQVSASLSSLKTGSGWICSGEAQMAELVQFPKISTYDNSATPTGDTAEIEIKMAPVDRDRLRAIIGDAAKDAEVDDPAKLRAQIAVLEKQISAPSNAAVKSDVPDLAAIEARGYTRGFDEALARGVRAMGDLWGHLLQPISKARAAFEEIEMTHEQLFNVVEGRAEGAPGLDGIPHEALTNITGNWPDIEKRLGRRDNQSDGGVESRHAKSGNTPGSVPGEEVVPLASRLVREDSQETATNLRAGVAPGPSDALRGAAPSLLMALARLDRNGKPQAKTWEEAAVLAGLVPGNGYFYKGRKELIDRGLVADVDGPKITSSGLIQFGKLHPLSLGAIVSIWRNKLRSPGDQILAQLADIPTRTVGTDELAAALSIKPGNGYWYKGVKVARDANLIEQDKGSFRLSEFLRTAPR